MQLEIRLYATLRKYAPPDSASGVFSFRLPARSSLKALLTSLGIEPEKVHLRMVNGVSVDQDHLLRDNDRIGLFPPVGGG